MDNYICLMLNLDRLVNVEISGPDNDAQLVSRYIRYAI